MSTKNENQLKVLITAMHGSGHLNACLGIGLLLSKRGHKVYFAHFPSSRSLIELQGIEFISLTDYVDSDVPIRSTFSQDNPFTKIFEMSLEKDPLELIKNGIYPRAGLIKLLETSKGENVAMKKIVQQLNPDVCLADYLFNFPWMFTVDCPVIPIMSSNPLQLYNGPPLGSGFSVKDSPVLWNEYRKYQEPFYDQLMSAIEKFFDHFKVAMKPMIYAEQMGIYIYPGPLDYHELGSPKKPWVRLGSSIRKPESSDFQIPDKLKDKPGKLIYLSMGTLACTVTKLMEMILTPLANLPHRFIVSTGPKGDSIKLHDNMWGDKFINQVALLPKVDLFITHGGSNSLIEGLAAGKPLIVIPLFGDQPDNAQRINDLGLGVKIGLHEFSDDKFLKAIEYVLESEEIHANVAKISKELKNSDSDDKIVSLIEKLARTKISPF